MKIGFEAKRLFGNFTGLGNYCRFLVGALSRHFPEHTYRLFTPRPSQHPEVTEITHRDNVEVIGPPSLYRALRLSPLWRSWGMSMSPAMKDLDIFHGLSHELPYGMPSRVKKVVTVHDLIFLRFPQFYNPIDVAIYKAKVQAACRKADRIIAISQQTADDLVHFLKVDPARIRVVYQGVHPIFEKKFSADEKERIRRKYQLPQRYILTVGTIESRKNAAILPRALSHLSPEERIPVVIVGRAKAYKDEVVRWAEKHQVLSSLIFIHHASFEDLPAIYQNAEVFVYPSLFEGFGIPLIEAIQSRVPVITSTGSCFSEAAGPYSLYVDPHDEKALAAQLSKVLHDQALRKQMMEQSWNYIQKFRPEVIAREMMDVYSAL